MLSHSSASSTWRSWLNFFRVFFFFFFSLKKLSQLDAIELARCPWARAMCLSELDGAEPARCSWASSQKLPNVLNCQVQSPPITLVLDMVPLKKPKLTVKTYPWWNWASYMFWASSEQWKIVDSTIQLYNFGWFGVLPILGNLHLWSLYLQSAVGGAITILKNDGVRQWEGLYIPYMKWKIKFHGLKPPTRLLYLGILVLV